MESIDLSNASFSISFHKDSNKFCSFENFLPVQQSTIKTVALIAITTSDRGQTPHLIDINEIHISDTSTSFTITNKLKTSNRILKP